MTSAEYAAMVYGLVMVQLNILRMNETHCLPVLSALVDLAFLPVCLPARLHTRQLRAQAALSRSVRLVE